MGARLVAASLPVYALAVGVLLFVNWQTGASHVEEYFSWGLPFDVAAAMLLVGGYRIGAFRRRLAVASVAYLLLALAPLVAVRALAVMPLGVLLYYLLVGLALYIDSALSLLYLERYLTLWRRSRAVAAESLARAGPFVIAVLLTPIVLSPRNWSEWSLHGTGTTIVLMTTAVAVASSVVLLSGLRLPRFPLRLFPIALTAVAILEAAWFVRGLPNEPMTIAGAPPLTLEYPAGRPALAGDVDAFRTMVISVVRRSGVSLPPAGVYARYRWHNGGPWDDPAPLSGAIAVTLWAEHMDDPAAGMKEFAQYMARLVIPANDGTVPDTNHPHWGYLNWALTPDAQAEPLLRTVCQQLTTNKFLGITDFDFAPYLRAEHDGGVVAARALHARWMTSPPGQREWDTLIRDSCAPPA